MANFNSKIINLAIFLPQWYYQSLTVSSVVHVPWRCGVLTTLGGTAGIGWGHFSGGEHASTPQSMISRTPTAKHRPRPCPVLIYFPGLAVGPPTAECPCSTSILRHDDEHVAKLDQEGPTRCSWKSWSTHIASFVLEEAFVVIRQSTLAISRRSP